MATEECNETLQAGEVIDASTAQLLLDEVKGMLRFLHTATDVGTSIVDAEYGFFCILEDMEGRLNKAMGFFKQQIGRQPQ